MSPADRGYLKHKYLTDCNKNRIIDISEGKKIMSVKVDGEKFENVGELGY